MYRSPMSSRTDYWYRISLPWWRQPGPADRTCPSICQAEIGHHFASISANRALTCPGPPYNQRYNPRRRYYWRFYISCRSLPPVQPPNRLSVNWKIDAHFNHIPVTSYIIYRVFGFASEFLCAKKTSYIMNQRHEKCEQHVNRISRCICIQAADFTVARSGKLWKIKCFPLISQVKFKNTIPDT